MVIRFTWESNYEISLKDEKKNKVFKTCEFYLLTNIESSQDNNFQRVLSHGIQRQKTLFLVLLSVKHEKFK